MNFQFTHPYYLLLLAPALAWVIWFAWKSDVQVSPWRRWTALGIRIVVLIALVFAIAGLQWRRPMEGMNVFFALDRSDSIPSPQQEAAKEYVNQASPRQKKKRGQGRRDRLRHRSQHRVVAQRRGGPAEDPGGGRHGTDGPGRRHPAGHRRVPRDRPEAPRRCCPTATRTSATP